MRCFRMTPLGLATLVSGLAPALAQSQSQPECFICDEVVEVDQAGADCFMAQLDDHRSTAATSADGFAEVNVYACYDPVDAKDRGGIDVMPKLATQGTAPGSGTAVDKTVYTLDLASIDCLARLVAQTPTFTPSEVFDLVVDCPE